MKVYIIGREYEQRTLQEAYEFNKSEFIAICGRRRVGKTFFAKKYFSYFTIVTICISTTKASLFK
jgi:AAA+ ATPase superfamily predicted ATPase